MGYIALTAFVLNVVVAVVLTVVFNATKLSTGDDETTPSTTWPTRCDVQTDDLFRGDERRE